MNPWRSPTDCEKQENWELLSEPCFLLQILNVEPHVHWYNYIGHIIISYITTGHVQIIRTYHTMGQNGTEPYRTPLRHCATAPLRLSVSCGSRRALCVCDNELPNRVKLATDEELPKEAKSWLWWADNLTQKMQSDKSIQIWQSGYLVVFQVKVSGPLRIRAGKALIWSYRPRNDI